MAERFIEKIIAKPRMVLLIAVLLVIPSIAGFLLTGVNYNLLSYLPGELDSIQGEVLLDEDFGCASMSFLIVEDIKSDELSKLKKDIVAIDCVSAVLSVDDILGSGVPLSMLPKQVTDLMYSTDGSSTLVLIKFLTSGADSETMDAINEINDMARSSCMMSGLSAILTDTRNIVNTQAPLYIFCAILGALLIFTVLSGSWITPPIVLSTLGLAVMYNMGTNLIFGEISYLTECIAVVLQLAVTMDYSVFLVERYHEELEEGNPRNTAILLAVKKSFSSLLGSSLTTVFGFAALCFMSLTLGFDIGIVMIKGVVFGLLCIFIILPAMLSLFGEAAEKHTHRFVSPNFNKINIFLIKKKAIFTAVFAILLIPSYILYANIDEYYSLDEMLGKEMPSIVALDKLKGDFGMASVDFAIVDDTLSDAHVKKLTNELSAVSGIKSVVSYGQVVGSAIPEDILPQSILSIVKNGNKQLILLISEHTAGHADSNEQINTLTGILKSYDPGSYITGEGPLTKDLVEIANNDFKVTTVISIAAILIIIALCLKSFTLPLILVAAIELAIMINEGISFIMGTQVPFIAPAVIGCVQLGATVDYAILLTNRYRQELENGYNKRQAMLVAANASASSIFKSVCVFFAATISVYLVCDVNIVKDLCLLLARGSMVSGAIIIFLLTPILVNFEKQISGSTIGWPKRTVGTATEGTVHTDEV